VPPPLAAFLCYAFIGYILAHEWKASKGLSKALWLPTIWLLLSVSRSLVYWFGSGGSVTDDAAYLEGSPIDRNVRTLLMLGGLLVLKPRQAAVQQVLRKNYLVLAIFALMGLSILWSDFPLVSFKRWLRAVGFLIMALIVLTERKPWKATDAVVRRVVYIAAPMSIMLIKYYPQIGITFHRWQGYPMWTGITISKNDLGVLCCYGAFFMVRGLTARPITKAVLRDKGFLIDLFLLLLCLHMLRGSGFSFSATSLLVFVCGVALHLGLARFKYDPAAFVKYVGGAAAVVSLLLILIPSVIIKSTTKSVGREENLTGRTEIWSAMLTEAMKRPILGTGYGAFYLGGLTYDWSGISGGNIGEGHNGYLDVFLELGLVGILLYGALIASACRTTAASVSTDFAEGGLRFTLLAMLLVHNVTESGFFSGVPSLWFLWLLAAMDREKSRSLAPVRGIGRLRRPRLARQAAV